MNKVSRRKLITGAVATTAGVSGLAVATSLADRYGLIPPARRGFYSPGDTLTYASQRLLTRHSLAREFPRSEISKAPFVNGPTFKNAEFKRLEAGGFVDWRLAIDGLVARPATLSLADIRSYPSRSQITHLACEEGWSYIAEWTGVPLGHVLEAVGILPQARYVIYSSMDPHWEDSMDMADALHPQTFLTYGLNGGDLPVGNGGPLRMRVPRQLGYKSVKHITRLKVTDTLKGYASDSSYSWYAGI
ncbi:MAG: molybdopterin-dependent oxidoreductase [Bryobacteraceae bacterium]